MPDRVASDTPGMETVQGTVERFGGTSRRRVSFPRGTPLPDGDVVRLVLDDREYRGRPVGGTDGPELRGAYDTPSGARDPGREPNRLAEWFDEHGLEPGRTVHLDVVEEGFRYGLRAPGQRATYDASRPDASLADIARTVTERD